MKITNRAAFHDYTISERFEAGIKLSGPEVKSVKGGHVSLTGSFVKVIGSEVFLLNANISPYSFARIEGYDPRRTRKLLLNKKEIMALTSKIEASALTLIPIAVYTRHGLVKVEVGVGRGKKQYEKRELLRARDEKRQLEREFRTKVS